MKHYFLKPGDKLVEAIFATRLTKHFSVYLGRLSDGQEWIAENHHSTAGVRLITFKDYQKSRRIVRIDRFNGTEHQRREAILRALQLAGKPYDLLQYNCEHFATEVTTGLPTSKQVRYVIGGLAVLLAVGLWYNQ